MTYNYKEWTAYLEADFLDQGGNGSSIGKGDSFTMPGSATVMMSTWDNDGNLSGDTRKNENANDHSGQKAYVDGERVGSQMYAEQYHVLHGSDGKTYYMIEIEVEHYNAPGSGDDFFTFYGAVPPAGTELSVVQSCNVKGCWVDYKCLGAGDMVPPNTPPHFTNFPDDGIICIDENTTFVIDLMADDADGDALTYEIVGGQDAEFFEIDAHTGELTFKNAPDFENPQSGANNNTYDVTVKVSDGNGGHEIKPLWVKIKDVEEGCDTCECIVIEAETMQLHGYKVEHRGDSSGGAGIKLTSASGTATTTFDGMDGTYDIKLTYIDENDGQGFIDIFVNGKFVDCISLDKDNNGNGADGHSTFSVHTIEDLMLSDGDTITLKGRGNCYEFARIDKIEICKDGDTCPPDFAKLTFNDLNAGDTIFDQFAGVTITAMENDPNDSATDNDAMVFDTNNPTGGDNDLSYSGRGNVLIISEDDDASDPDDAAHGGMINFAFDNPSDLSNIVLLDIEEAGGTIELTFEDDSSTTIAIPAAGDNSAQTIDLSASNVTNMKITLVGSGAVDDLCWKPGDAPEPGSLSGRYFCDTNDNDVDDGQAVDPGIEGVVVTVKDAGGNVVGTTTTDAEGNYSVTGLEPGDYSVEFSDPSGVLADKGLVNPNVGGDDSIDSDAIGDTTLSTIDNITVNAGQDTPDNDAGAELLPGSLSGRYFCDTNDNDVDDGQAVDPGIEGVVVTVKDAGGNVVGTTTTDAEGNYSVGGLAAGDYSVEFSDPIGVLADKGLVNPNVGGDDSIDSDAIGDTTLSTIGNITVNAGQDTPDNDAGAELLPGSLSGRYFCDVDRDDTDDGQAVDPGVAGIVVTVKDAGGNVVGTTTTDDEGNYSVGGLAPGSYSVEFTDPDAVLVGKALVAPNVGNDDTIDSDAIGDTTLSVIENIAVNAGQDTPDNDAGVATLPGALSGTYFCDEDRDGVDDGAAAGDKDVAGKEVKLLNPDGSPAVDIDGNPVASVFTDAEGNYRFDNLAPGDYVVEFEETAGKEFIAPNVGQPGTDDVADDSDVTSPFGQTDPVTVNAGEETTDVDAGVQTQLGSLSGRYFCDDNRDGLDNDGEFGGASDGIEGIEVALLDAAGNPTGRTTTTDASGNYSFTGLLPGVYGVLFTDPANAADGKILTTANVDGDVSDDIDSDAIGSTASATIQGIEVVANQDTPDNDAGVFPNDPPIANDDVGKTCADEELVINLLANDVDPNSDALSVTAISDADESVGVGGTITLADGATVTLNADGSVTVDGEAAYSSLALGAEATDSFSYTVQDSLGAEATGNVDLTFCGYASVETVANLVEGATISYQILQGPTAASFIDGYSLEILSSDNANIPLGTYELAYCIDLLQQINPGVLSQANILVATEANAVAVGSTGLNAENIDAVNWLLNNDQTLVDNGDGTGDTYTDIEVQEAIWTLMNDDTFIINNFGVPEYQDDGNGVRDGVEIATLENVNEIAAAALANGNGFVPQDGDVFGLIVDPFDPASQDQPFIIGVTYECIC